MNVADSDDYEFIEVEPTQNIDRYLDDLLRLNRAIFVAKERGYLAAEAIANEKIAEFYIKYGKSKLAGAYFQTARELHLQVGDSLSAENLQQAYSQYFDLPESNGGQPRENNFFTDDFVATIGYEFRNPLNGILGMSETLLEEVFGPMNERQLNAVSTIDRSGWYLLGLINNMVDLSKIQVGKLELEISTVAVAELCNSSIAFVKHHAIQKQVKLDLLVPDESVIIAADFQRMRQITIDLLDRAIDSTPAGGKVELIATKLDNGIQLSILDTSKDLSQAKIPTANAERRIGFGLMLVQPIVDLHGGSLDYRSEIGRGSRVDIFLPETRSNISIDRDYPATVEYLTTSTESIARDLTEPPLILIAEDNELNINTIASYLTAKGYRPIIAQDGRAAIDLAQANHPDLILMDIQMPGMDGLEAITLMRQDARLADTPIIAITALAMDGDRERTIAAGANDYMTKPVRLKELNLKIQELLNR
jgi:signal transduction histidine kinase